MILYKTVAETGDLAWSWPLIFIHVLKTFIFCGNAKYQAQYLHPFLKQNFQDKSGAATKGGVPVVKSGEKQTKLLCLGALLLLVPWNNQNLNLLLPEFYFIFQNDIAISKLEAKNILGLTDKMAFINGFDLVKRQGY